MEQSAQKTNPADAFEGCIDTIKQKLDQLNSPDITLAQSMNIYKEGISEIKKAQEILEQIKLEYEEIS